GGDRAAHGRADRRRGGRCSVTATADQAPHEAPDQAPPAAPPRRSRGRRLLDLYLYGNVVVVTLLAFLCALVVGAVLIVVADEATRASFGYFFSAPGDTFSN